MKSEVSIAIVDYGMGNLRSVEKAFAQVGFPAVVTSQPSDIANADAVVLPGVGAFGDAVKELMARGILEVVRNRAAEARDGGRPFLGICLGMQILVEFGEESGGCEGLSVIEGTCPRLQRKDLKVPHMGWNSLSIKKQDNPLFEGVGTSPYVYFVHSYAVVPSSLGVIAAVSDYGGEVVASLKAKNLFATQFHPEKSQDVGLRMLKNFGELAKSQSSLQGTGTSTL
jgi:glutamine amidotransferase